MAVSSNNSLLLLVLVKTVFFVETIDPSIRLREPLFAGVKRVAVVAGVDSYFFKS